MARIFNSQGEEFLRRFERCYDGSVTKFHGARPGVFGKYFRRKRYAYGGRNFEKRFPGIQARQLDDIYRLSKYISENKFLKAQIAQVHRTLGGDFVLIPQVGNHKIIFGSAYTDAEVKEKLDKLVVFYEEGLPYEGWSKYETINLKFRDQIVCKKYPVVEPPVE